MPHARWPCQRVRWGPLGRLQTAKTIFSCMLTENWLLCVCEFERGERLKSKHESVCEIGYISNEYIRTVLRLSERHGLTLPSLSHVTQSVGCDEHRLPAALRPQTPPRRSAESTIQRQRRPSRLAAAAFSSLTRMKRPAQTAEPEEGTLTSQAWRPRPRPLSPQQSLRPTQPPQGAAEARREASGRRRHSACPPTLPRWLVRRRGRLVRRRGRRRRRRQRWRRRHWRRQRGRRRSGS